MRRLCLPTLLALLAVILWPSFGLAATSGLAISPPTFELSANPGDSLSNGIRVENLSDTPATITVDKRNFVAAGESGQADLVNEDTGYSMSSWISVSPTSYVIPPHGSKVFNFTIAVPVNAQPGGHFGSIVFQSAGGKISATGVSVSEEVASLIFMKIAGKVVENLGVEGFAPTARLREYGPVELSARLHNNGNVHVLPTLKVRITDIFGRTVANLDPAGHNVLPGATRRFDTTWNKQHLLGYYTATLTVVYGSNEQQILVATTGFWVFPWRLFGIMLLILGLLALAAYRGRARLSQAWRVLIGR